MKKKNVILLAILLLVAVTSGIVAVTYSRYMTSVSGEATANIAGWHIKLDGTELTTQSEFTPKDFTWTRLNSDGSTAEGFIAPGYEGTTSITLDASGTQVDMQYSITIDTSDLALDDYPEFEIYVNNSKVTYSGDSFSVGNIFYVGDINKEISIPIEIRWNNYDTEQYNALDTALAKEVDKIVIPITVTCKQFVGATAGVHQDPVTDPEEEIQP